MRVFKGHGKRFEFPDDTMATKYTPDTCNCVIIYDKNDNFLATETKCQVHKNFNGQALLDKIVAHNQSFNLKFGRSPTKEQDKTIFADKRKEKNRIQRLANT